MSGTGLEVLPEVRDGSVGPPRGSGRIGRPSRKFELPYWRSGTCRKAHPDIRNGLRGPPRGPDGSGGPPRVPGQGGRPSGKSGSGREALKEVWELSQGTSSGLGWVGRNGTGWEDQEWSGSPPGGL